MAPNYSPLMTSVAAVLEDDPAITGAASPQTITVHLKAKSGQTYHLPLSEEAAQAHHHVDVLAPSARILRRALRTRL
jgi:hypothetical protein